ncbi:hypothetical protein ACFQDN_21645 [Pseudomonas asuensis]|uniref:hypothetical protein n=1 Tax=Pseudomonas asuensis TaxID=1825787 RepID=UPI001665F0A0|nr:hypothetical protein [Pseudomonas asuensis]
MNTSAIDQACAALQKAPISTISMTLATIATFFFYLVAPFGSMFFIASMIAVISFAFMLLQVAEVTSAASERALKRQKNSYRH